MRCLNSVFSILGLVMVVSILIATPSYGDVVQVFLNSSGAVQSTDLTATFDSLVYGNSLTSYQEDNLQFSIPGAYDANGFSPAPAGFSGGFFYPSGGSSNPLTITTTNGATLYGIQFYLGSGFAGEMSAGDKLPIGYEILSGASIVASGSFNATQTSSGYLLGFRDISGFSSLVISNCSPGAISCTTSSYNAIAIDNVKADTTLPSVTPEPASMILFGTGMLGVIFVTRKQLLGNSPRRMSFS